MKKFVSIFILVCFSITGQMGECPVYAQVDPLPFMPQPGVMVNLSPEFTPAYLKGIVIHPENPLKFDFIIYKGDKLLSYSQKREEYTKLTKYFLASLAIPDDDQWVNLSPYEKDRIIKDNFGKTEMGRDLLAQDYMLKQITASLIYPEDNLGKEFWNKVYAQAQKQYGTTNIPVNTFNKVWILPDDALIYEKSNENKSGLDKQGTGNITAYVLKNHLRVMLEEDYLSLQKHSGIQSAPVNKTHAIASKIVREIVLPELQREVNEDKNFVALRQVYSGMLLAAWFKRTLKQSLLGQIYANKAKVRGVDQDPKTNEEIYQRYLQAYKKGVFNFIKEDVNKYTNETIPRKYFSGGANGYDQAMTILGKDPIVVDHALTAEGIVQIKINMPFMDLAQVTMQEDKAMTSRTRNQRQKTRSRTQRQDDVPIYSIIPDRVVYNERLSLDKIPYPNFRKMVQEELQQLRTKLRPDIFTQENTISLLFGEGREEITSQLIHLASRLRGVFSFRDSIDSSLTPLRYGITNNIIFQIAPNLYICPTTESFRRHFIFKTDKQGRVIYVYEFMIPGAMRIKRKIAGPRRARIAQEVNEIWQDGDSARVLFTREFDYHGQPLYGRIRLEKAEIAVFDYTFDGKRYSYLKPNVISAWSKEFGLSPEAFRAMILKEAVSRLVAVSLLGYFGNSDDHLNNIRVGPMYTPAGKSMKVQLVADYGAYSIVPTKAFLVALASSVTVLIMTHSLSSMLYTAFFGFATGFLGGPYLNMLSQWGDSSGIIARFKRFGEIKKEMRGKLLARFNSPSDAAMITDEEILADLGKVESTFPELSQATRNWIKNYGSHTDDLMLAMESMVIRRSWYEVMNEYQYMIQRPQDFKGITQLEISEAKEKFPILKSLFDAFQQKSKELVDPLKDRVNMGTLQAKVETVFQAYGFLLASISFGHLRGTTDFMVNDKPWDEGIFDEYLSDPMNWDKPARVELKGEDKLIIEVVDAAMIDTAQGRAKVFRDWAEQKRGQKLEETQSVLSKQFGLSVHTIGKILNEKDVESAGNESETLRDFRAWAKEKRGQRVDETQIALAKRFKLSKSTVSQTLIDHNVTSVGDKEQEVKAFRTWAKQKRGQRINETQAELCEQFSLSPGEVSRVLTEFEITSAGYKAEEAKALRKWAEPRRNQKVPETQGALGEYFGLTQSAVSRILVEYSITTGYETEEVKVFKKWAKQQRARKVLNTLESLCKQFKLSQMVVSHILTKNKIAPAGDQIIDLKALREWARGKRGAKIAQTRASLSKQFRVSLAAVDKTLSEFEITTAEDEKRVIIPMGDSPAEDYLRTIGENLSNRKLRVTFDDFMRVHRTNLGTMPKEKVRQILINNYNVSIDAAMTVGVPTGSLQNLNLSKDNPTALSVINEIEAVLINLRTQDEGAGQDGGDVAMVSHNDMATKGGIDLNSANLAMIIKRDGHGVQMPLSQQDLAQLSNIEGLDPVILSIKPASQTALFSELVAHP